MSKSVLFKLKKQYKDHPMVKQSKPIMIFVTSFLLCKILSNNQVLIIIFVYVKQDTFIPEKDNQIFPVAAISTEVGQCSDIGKEILQSGGNAVDATIAGALCVGLINNFSAGIGGGGFMLIRTAEGNTDHIDFRETASAAAFKDMFKDNESGSTIGGLATCVP